MPKDVQEGKASKAWYWMILAVVAIIVLSMWIYARPVWAKAVTEREQLVEIRRQNDLLVEQNTVLERIAVCLEVRHRMEFGKWANGESEQDAERAK